MNEIPENIDKEELLDHLRSTVDDMISDFIDGPEDDLPPCGFMFTRDEGMGLIPLGALVNDDMTKHFLCTVMIPKLITQMNAFAFATVVTAWRADGMAPDELQSLLDSGGKISDLEDKREAIWLSVCFADGALYMAHREITRHDDELPDFADWDNMDPYEWQGNSGLMVDSIMATLTGSKILSQSMIEHVAGIMANSEQLNREIAGLLTERGFPPERVAALMEEHGDEMPPELEMALMTLPQEFRDRMAAFAEEHMPEYGEAHMKQMMREHEAKVRAPHRQLADDVKGRISR